MVGVGGWEGERGTFLKLDVLFQAQSLESLQAEIEKHFNQKVRLIKEQNSIFEQWQVRSAERIFIPKVWTYRVIFHQGIFHFGTV
jgi:hypothetical protein